MIADELADEWDLRLDPPLVHGGMTAWVAPATTSDGERVVVKVTWPHDEAEHEADALRRWDGKGAVRLLRHDRRRWALLLERCVPGHALGTSWADDTIDLGCALLQRLWVRADAGEPYRHVSEVTPRWAGETRERASRLDHGLDPGVIDAGVGLLETLPDPGERFLLHQDFHPENVLAAEREPWLVIDPKPVVGDRGFDTVRLVTQGVVDERHLRDRLARVEDLLGVDAERMRLWALARTVATTLYSIDHDGDDGGWAAQLQVLAG